MNSFAPNFAHQLCKELTRLFGVDVAVDTDGNHYIKFTFDKKKDYGVAVRLDSNSTNLKVYGNYPTHQGTHIVNGYLDRGASLPSIGVDSRRGEAAVAEAIQKRFWPTYLPLYVKCREALDNLARRDTERLEVLAQLDDEAQKIGVSTFDRNRDADYFGARHDATNVHLTTSVTSRRPLHLKFELSDVDPSEVFVIYKALIALRTKKKKGKK